MADVLNCKRCGGTILVTGYCSQCGLKSEYVNKALNTSKYYYNIGLDKARVRDMTGAKEALQNALKYDKMNIDARNLLGLIYYETGEVVLALSHWVVSVNYFSGRNVAKRYIKEVKSNPHKLESANIVARKYNQALAYAKQGSKDLAFIQLRKVLAENPKFVNGYLLLALLFIDEGRYEKARKALKRVIKIDRTNPLAVRYFNDMGHSDDEIMDFRDFPEDDYDADLLFVEDQPRAYVEPDNVDLNGEPVPVGRYKDINFYKYSIAYVIAGLVLGLAVMGFLVIPHRDKNMESDNRDLKIGFSEAIAAKNVEISTLEASIEDLNQDVSDYETQISDLNRRLGSYEDAQKAVLPDEDKVTLQQALNKYYNEDYDSAVSDLNRLMEDYPDNDVILFYKGMCHLNVGNTAQAKEAFSALVERCPNSAYYTIAVSYGGEGLPATTEDGTGARPEDEEADSAEDEESEESTDASGVTG